MDAVAGCIGTVVVPASLTSGLGACLGGAGCGMMAAGAKCQVQGLSSKWKRSTSMGSSVYHILHSSHRQTLMNRAAVPEIFHLASKTAESIGGMHSLALAVFSTVAILRIVMTWHITYHQLAQNFSFW